MKKTVFLVLPLLPMLAGCADTFQNLNTGLAALKGQPIEAAIDKLGYPDSQLNIRDQVIYQWSTDRIESYGAPAGGFIDGGYDGYAGYGGTMHTVSLRCKLSLVTKDNVIIDSRYEGEEAGCYRYGEELKPVKNQNPASNP
jgi:hypothetical protein